LACRQLNIGRSTGRSETGNQRQAVIPSFRVCVKCVLAGMAAQSGHSAYLAMSLMCQFRSVAEGGGEVRGANHKKMVLFNLWTAWVEFH
jgi:hypothetical protein